MRAWPAVRVGVLGLIVGLAQASQAIAQTGTPRTGNTSGAGTGACTSASDDDRERRVMERFLSLLEKSPRRGTALDRVYGYHVERGSLDAFLKTYQDRVAANPKEGAAWMILGLVEAQRGRDAAAAAALKQAEATRPDDPLPPYYLGQALVLLGQPDAAAEAFERALKRNPPRTEMLEIFQALGRVYQRAHRTQQALAVWNRLEQSFPDDLRVQEQIASALGEEGQSAEALKRFESLAQKTRDGYRKVEFQVEAADLKVRLGKSQEALGDFETLLAQLNPESWLYREVRHRIEDVFLRNDDQAGLARYYEAWIKKTPDDVDAMARLGRALAAQGRAADAQAWFDRAVTLAPARKELRLALVEQLVHEKKFAQAAAQYEALAKNDPNNPDYVREWGKLLLKDTAKPEPDRKQAAAAVWRRLVQAKPSDAAAAVQAADLFRQAGMTDDAIALYKKAIELDAASPQYREYLGEYYHVLKRSDEALATWKQMAAGANRNARNLGRLAEVLSGFGYRTEAVSAAAEACALDRESFELHLKYADLLFAVERFADAGAELEFTARLADDADQAEAVLDRQIKTDQAAGKLPARVAALAQSLAAGQGQGPAAESWRRLARYLEADQKQTEAIAAIQRALAIDAASVPAWSTAARLFEASGRLQEAADAYRKLAGLDRRALTDYLTSVARIEARLGRHDQALRAGRKLLAAAPNNPEHYEFFADLCFQLGDTDEGFDALRRAARLNETDPKALLTLADALAKQFRTEEAIELFWQALERTKEIDAKLGLVARLTELYLQRNQFDRLIARLERMGREADQQREMALCLAQAHASSGDYGTARQELERLLAANSRDTQLLQQLSSLAENEGDPAGAARYQKQLYDIAPSDDAAARLAQLYLRAGEASEAEAVLARLAADDHDTHRILLALDSLHTSGKHETALAITDRLLRSQPENWELLYREGRAIMALGRPAEAARHFEALLALRTSDDEVSAILRARRRTSGLPGAPPAGAMAGGMPSMRTTFPIHDRTIAVFQLRLAAGLQQGFYNAGPGSLAWMPADFGQARMAALAFLFDIAQRNEQHEAFLNRLKQACTGAPGDSRPRWDLYYLQLVREQPRETFEASRALAGAAPADPAAQWVFLSSLPGRAPGASRYVRQPLPGAADHTRPLPPEQLDMVLASFETLLKRQPTWVNAQILTSVATELKRAKRTDASDRFYQRALQAAADADAVSNVMQLAAERGDIDGLLTLFDRYARLQAGRQARQSLLLNQSQQVMMSSSPTDAMARAMAARADARAHGDILRLLDRYFAFLRQPDQAAQRLRSRHASSLNANAAMVRTNFQVYVGKTPRRMNVDYPSPGLYFDYGSIQLLRNAFELFKRDDLVSDLLAHYQVAGRPPAGEAAGAAADPVYAHLITSALRWWNEEEDEALGQLGEAADLVPGDPELRLDLAELRAGRNEPSEALALADSVEPLDQKTLQRRETLALRLAVLTGDIERARKAAERLFGLRLDSGTQLMLAGQMHQLGMHDLAEAMLARARRRAGNNINLLVTLMGQYQRQGKPEVAAQVAHQILRRAGTRTFSPYGGDSNEYARQEAVQVLARSGKLDELIARIKSQIEHSPSSPQLYQSLADYYRAAGKRDELKATYKTMAALRPDDAKLQFQIAAQLVQAGDAPGSLELFKAAIQREPILYAYRNGEVQSAFQAARKTDELVDLLESIDLHSLSSNPYVVTNLVQSLAGDEKTRVRAMGLFRKAWKAFPGSRNELINALYNEQVWKLPEVYDFAREAFLPAPAQTELRAWEAAESVMTFNSDGKAVGLVTRLLEAATRQNKVDALARDVEEALKRVPDWSSGKAVLAILQLRRGRTEDAVQKLQELLRDDRNGVSEIPVYARLVIGQELEDFGATLPLAMELYETSVRNAASEPINLNFQYHPIRRLVLLYRRAGRAAEARELTLKFMEGWHERFNNFDSRAAAYQRLTELSQVAQQMLELGFPADALRAYSAILQDTDARELASMYMGNADIMVGQARDGMSRSLRNMKREGLEQTVRTLARPADHPQPGAPALDLMLMVHPRELDRAEVTSVFASATSAAASSPALLAEVTQGLHALRERDPHDFSVLTALALVAAAEGKASAILEAGRALEQAAQEAPLEPIAADTRPNARQRAAAAPRLPLWLVARACWKLPEGQALGDRLAGLALEAARRQSDDIWALAMLREWGQRALDAGDRRTAEDRWTQMLSLVVPPPAKTKPRPRPRPRAAPPDAPAPTAPGAGPAALRSSGRIHRVSQAQAVAVPPAPAGAGSPSTRSAGMAVTLDRFEQAAQLARLAAERGMPELSVRAIREALQGGPPMNPLPMNRAVMAGNLVRVGPAADNQQDQGAQLVQTQVAELELLWLKHGAPAEGVYQALREAVAPEGRPLEVFLYARPLAVLENSYPPRMTDPESLRQPHSVAAMLARWAVRANQAADLRQRLEPRLTQPLAELPGLVALAQAELAAADWPRARQRLEALARRVEKDSLATTAELACHAALPALEQAETEAAALPVVTRAVKTLGTQPNEEPLGTLTIALARHQFRMRRAHEARQQFEESLTALERITTRYGGEFAFYRRRIHLRRVAGEHLRAGDLAGALDVLGQYADVPPWRYGDPPLGTVLASFARQLAARPAQERFDQLRTWTLPTASRNSVRLLASFVPQDVPPETFGKLATSSFHGGLVTTASLLIDAARELRRLDALAAEVQPLADQKVENAELLLALIQAARGEAGTLPAQLRAATAELTQRSHETDIAKRRVLWSEFLLARAALAVDDPNVREQALTLAGAFAAVGQDNAVSSVSVMMAQETGRLLAHAAHDRAGHLARQAGAADAAAASDPGLALWQPSSLPAVAELSAGAAPGLWAASAGHVAHASGPGEDFLSFAYPLTGSFTVSVDACIGSSPGAGLSFGGLVYQPAQGRPSRVWPAGRMAPGESAEGLSRRTEFLRPDAFNRLTLEVSPGSVRFLINGHLFHDDPHPNPACPWLALFAPGERHAVFRHVAISGAAEIPREVRLIEGDRLDGWMASFFQETTPPHPELARAPDLNQPRLRRPQLGSDEPDWHARDGVLIGRRTQAVAAPRPVGSLLAHARPLREGESIAYEFRYDPDAALVHPALGRLVFLLEPARIRLRWLTDPADDWTGLPADNAVDEPACRRGPDRLPLQPGAWNALTVRLAEGQVRLALNGQAVYERPLDPAADRHFGVYHEKDRTEAQVRHVVLRGEWPSTIPAETLAHLLAPAGSEPAPPERQARHAIVGEAYFASQAHDLLNQARTLGAKERFELLSAWVLPGPDHPGFRLAGDFAPTDPPPAGDTGGQAYGSPRAHTGGVLEAPAIELVATANELGTLAALADRVRQAKPATEPDHRGRLALLALIHAAQGEDDQAKATLTELTARVQAMPPSTPRWQRWPEQVAQWQALERPALVPASARLANVIAEQVDQIAAQQEKTPFPGLHDWQRQVAHARARAQVAALPREPHRAFGRDPGLPGWAAVVHATAASRGAGLPLPLWLEQDGEIVHHPGHHHDLLYRTAPLRGDFEATCELTGFGPDQIQLTYGGLTIGIAADRKAVELSHLGRNVRRVELSPPVEEIKGFYPFRLVVHDGTATAFLGDRKLLEERLPAGSDPWLALHQEATGTGRMRNFKVTGQSSVPERLEIAAGPELNGWLADYFDEPTTAAQAAWQKRGEEITARAFTEAEAPNEAAARNPRPGVTPPRSYTIGIPGSHHESLLQYHRPLLEDGELTYEFSYEPGKVLVHPALDRLVFLLDPAGVKVHWLTDGAFDRTGLAPANAHDERAHRRGPQAQALPFRPHSWNTLTLRLKGDVVTLVLNGTEIYERPLEPTNQRQFGFFHFADQTEVRVRKVIYAGAWTR